MADTIADLKTLIQPFIDGMNAMEGRTDRATMWAVREVARQVKKEAARRAPVYDKKQATLTMGQFRKFQRVTKYRGGISNSVVISGLLKGSISSSRRLQSVKTGDYSVKVGPRGQRVHLYAGKAEARQPYMKPAYDAVIPTMGTVAAGAWARAMAKGS